MPNPMKKKTLIILLAGLEISLLTFLALVVWH